MLDQLDLLEAGPRIEGALQVAHLENDVDLAELALQDGPAQSILDGIVL